MADHSGLCAHASARGTALRAKTTVRATRTRRATTRGDASSRASSRIVAREDPSNTGGGKVSSGANDEPRRDVIEEASEPGELREHRTCERGAREECPEGTGGKGAH